MATDEVFTLRERNDRAHPDGGTRYGAYLRRHKHLFDDGTGQPTTEPAWFAAAAFVIAREPIMSPPYVATHPRVVLAEPMWDTEGRGAVVIEFATWTPARLGDQLPMTAVGWRRDRTDGQFHLPDDHTDLTAFSRLTIRVSLPVDLLPAPIYTDSGVADVDTAKRAVRTVSNHANSLLTHVVVHLEHDATGDQTWWWPTTPS